MKKIFFILFILSLSLFAKNFIDIVPSQVKNGSSFAFIFQSDTAQQKAPYIKFLNKTYQLYTINGSIQNYEAFIPVDYHTQLDNYPIELYLYKDNNCLSEQYTIKVIDGNYIKNEIITVKKGTVQLSPSNKEKTKNEYDEVFKKVYGVTTQYDLTNNNSFINPLDSNFTSYYGTARTYNNIAKSYHSGSDFKASIGTPIKATNNGKVVLVMDRFYLGLVVYIDHGRGAYSYYAHLSKSLVKEGDMVKKEQIIALSGKSGRITGPHLHYAMRLHNVTVDPIEYGNLYNKIIQKYH